MVGPWQLASADPGMWLAWGCSPTGGPLQAPHVPRLGHAHRVTRNFEPAGTTAQRKLLTEVHVILCHITYPRAPGLTRSGAGCMALIPFYEREMGAQRGALLELQSGLTQVGPASRPLDPHRDKQMTDGDQDTRTSPPEEVALSSQPEPLVGRQRGRADFPQSQTISPSTGQHPRP